MGKNMEKFTDSVAQKIWGRMEEEQRKCEESKSQVITEKQITEFGESLYETEHSDNTIQRYCQEVRKFMEFLDERVPEKQLFVEYRDLEKKQYNVRLGEILEEETKKKSKEYGQKGHLVIITKQTK